MQTNRFQYTEGDPGARMRLRSQERRIEGQHERLDLLCREVYATLGKDGPAAAINDFLLYKSAVEAHMTLEEEMFFPALHGLRGDLSGVLTQLVREHDEVRVELDEIKQGLKRQDGVAARLGLESLARLFEQHEKVEEDLLAHVTEGPIAAQVPG